MSFKKAISRRSKYGEKNKRKRPKINKKEYPEDYKFSLMACNKENSQEFVRLDNHHNKPPHWHDDEQ